MDGFYVLIICDRHTDPEPSLFARYQDAVAAGRAYVDHIGGEIEDENHGTDDDHNKPAWWATWSEEDDHMQVTWAEVERTRS